MRESRHLLEELLIALLFLCTSVYADSIVLKNGKILEGTIVSEMKDVIIFKDDHGTLTNLKRDEINQIMKGAVAAKKVQTNEKSGPPKVVTQEYLDSLRDKYDLGQGSFGESEKIEIVSSTPDFSIEQNSDFKTDVLLARVPVLVDFYADWCGPCKVIAPRIEAVEKQFAGKMRVYRVNIDQDKDTAAFYSIQAIPTLLFFKDGAVQEKIVGAVSQQAISTIVNKLVK